MTNIIKAEQDELLAKNCGTFKWIMVIASMTAFAFLNLSVTIFGHCHVFFLKPEITFYRWEGRVLIYELSYLDWLASCIHTQWRGPA